MDFLLLVAGVFSQEPNGNNRFLTLLPAPGALAGDALSIGRLQRGKFKYAPAKPRGKYS
jgi:hypothetical protein